MEALLARPSDLTFGCVDAATPGLLGVIAATDCGRRACRLRALRESVAIATGARSPMRPVSERSLQRRVMATTASPRPVIGVALRSEHVGAFGWKQSAHTRRWATPRVPDLWEE